MEFSEKLMDLRRRAGLSQEQLAQRLGVTRQSVSKWESGCAMPELVKLIALSDMFSVSLDDLVRGQSPEKQESVDTTRLEEKIDTLARECRGSYFRYTSPVRLLGLPLLDIRFGRDRSPTRYNTAVGIVAVGNFSVGVVSVGLISAGGISLGMLAFGGVALGMVAVGYLALGMTAVGVYAAGAAALGAKVAVGTAASGAVAIGRDAQGADTLALTRGLTAAKAESFLLTHQSGLWRPMARLFAALAAWIA
ncbi:helix-turn-helix transcriptional regulator [Oscillibacter sp.]|uniref:helix-turn-helix domain-containing protein n=1 Tax=Oscillibacter sp. TaxID=1945593 RepID=UPI002615D05A|nr:helix-turn-helix transcriptional regulator [Oscillibacter sp.]MDD3347129.1 helix-turn-helix transcriptional regulator [Oscillibacter sp.]